MENKDSRFQSQGVIIILAVLTTFLWGSAFPCIKIGYDFFALTDDPAGQILFAGYRFSLSGVMLILMTFLRSKRVVLPDRSNFFGIISLGLVQTSLQYTLFYMGLANTTGTKGSIISSSNPFIAIVLAYIFYKNERITIRKGLGCAVGFAGVILVNLSGTGIEGGFSFEGEGMMFLAAAAAGAGAVMIKRISQKGDSVMITGYQLFFGGAVMILLGLIGKGSLHKVNPEGILILLYLALLSAIAFAFWTVLLKYNEIGRITVYSFLIPVFGVSLSAAFLGETVLEVKNLVALLLVCTGIFLINRPRKQKAGPEEQ